MFSCARKESAFGLVELDDAEAADELLSDRALSTRSFELDDTFEDGVLGVLAEELVDVLEPELELGCWFPEPQALSAHTAMHSTTKHMSDDLVRPCICIISLREMWM